MHEVIDKNQKNEAGAEKSMLSICERRDLEAFKVKIAECGGRWQILTHGWWQECKERGEEEPDWMADFLKQEYALLHFALHEGFVEAAVLLIERGVDPIYCDPASFHQFLDRQKELLIIGREDEDHVLSALQKERKRVKKTSHILEACMSLNQHFPDDLSRQLIGDILDEDVQTLLLSWAATHDDIKYLRWMVEDAGWAVRDPQDLPLPPKMSFKEKIESNWPISRDGLLSYAAEDHLIAHMNLLVKAGADLDGGVRRERLYSAVGEAVMCRQWEAARFLMNQRAFKSPVSDDAIYFLLENEHDPMNWRGTSKHKKLDEHQVKESIRFHDEFIEWVFDSEDESLIQRLL